MVTSKDAGSEESACTCVMTQAAFAVPRGVAARDEKAAAAQATGSQSK
jgi:hypothetical protein